MYYKMLLDINKKKYQVNYDEFTRKNIPEFCNLRILNDLGLFERLVSLFFELRNSYIKNMVCFNTTHGGFLPIECSAFFDNITLVNTDPIHTNNINTNVASHSTKNIQLVDYNLTPKCNNYNNSLVFSSDATNIDASFLVEYRNNVFVTDRVLNGFQHTFQLKNSGLYIHLNENNISGFKETFQHFFEDEQVLNYDNLIHLCIMVKNGGPQFESMLNQNLSLIDRWTILDTGSTDNTIEIINKVLVGKKKGELFQEPFINFKDSRNRCLDLAGKACKYTLMLDDTYVIEGNLREFLQTVRGDQLSDSFSIIIKSDDMEYGSNRLIKSSTGLRYKYKIHEVIDDKNNMNIIIPKNNAIINDGRFDYMEKRTMNRKELDLKLLYEEVEENPSEPRTYYYLAQTYNLLEKYELAYEFFLKRASFCNSGFIQERIDAVFEAARIANFKLNKPWEECLYLYEKAFKIDETRPESQYFIGIHHHLKGDNKKAFEYFKRAFEIGYPIHCQYSLKPTLSFHFLPKFLCRLCYEMKDYILGEAAALLFLQNNTPDAEGFQEIISWYAIYKKMNMCPKRSAPVISEKPIFCFIADGGFEPWSGKNILTTGVGGSETYIIEMARYIQLSGQYNVVVFCNCLEEEVFENVQYKPIDSLYSYIYTNYVHSCIVSRFSEYLPVAFKGWTENVYLVVHDLTPSGIVIPLDPKLKNVFCLTEWHVEYMNQIFPSLKHLTVPFYYGIDFSKFKKQVEKIPFKFIYSSFPNRGLLQLIQLWPKIHEKQPLATLHIYSDIDGKWVNDVAAEQMKEIKALLSVYKTRENGLGIHYYGWVDKKTLADSWSSADIWFYPCTFMETFCLTALEAALSKTLVITNDLAALQNSVGERGVVIKGDATSSDWQNSALEKVFEYMDSLNIETKNAFIERNYEWASKLSWENQAKNMLSNYILPHNKLECKQLYNWTNLPFNEETGQFLKALEYFKTQYSEKLERPSKILEIGTYTGLSLINIVKLIPNSLGFGIDKWSNYTILNDKEKNSMEYIEELQVEKSFYKNIALENLSDRIVGIKGQSKDILLDMVIKNQDCFDFIYIDASQKALDCYIDVFLSWKLLNKGGIMAIDDYLYFVDDKLESPYEAVTKFLQETTGEYKVLYSGYRVFLEKL
jgi:predicted O-methyltransferase YrrM/tetratricopeptide (TPR) repeat protein